jgi:hypothetical protein
MNDRSSGTSELLAVFTGGRTFVGRRGRLRWWRYALDDAAEMTTTVAPNGSVGMIAVGLGTVFVPLHWPTAQVSRKSLYYTAYVKVHSGLEVVGPSNGPGPRRA